jgi:hypothetical protein
MLVTYNKEITIECDKGYYTRDELSMYHVRLFDSNYKLIAAFDGVWYLSKFEVTGGELKLITTSSTDTCKLAFMRDDGVVAEGPSIDTFLRGNVPFKHNMLLTSKHFGSTLPSSGVEGQIFFKLAE